MPTFASLWKAILYRTFCYTLAIIFIAGFSAYDAIAADNPQTSEDFWSDIGQTIDEQDERNHMDDQSTIFPQLVPNEVLSEEGKLAQKRSLTSYYEYRIQGFEHRRRVFEWQYYSSIVIFFMVVFIVSLGLYFSWMQFHATENPNDMPSSNIEASTTSIKVSSPVLGVIILVLSLAFFYLYLVYVYPIVDII